MERSLAAGLLAVQQVLALRRGPDGRFALAASAPAWFAALDEGVRDEGEAAISPVELFPYLEAFLPEAGACWRGNGPALVRSGVWAQTTAAGEDLHFEATACFADGVPCLLIRRLEVDFDERHRVLQRAREMSLDYERLLREISKKEILLHCIIHDLSGPLSAMQGCWHMLAREPLTVDGREFVQLGQLEAQKQANLIRDLLDVFAAEVNALEREAVDPANAPDLGACAREVVEGLAPAFALKEVTASVCCEPDPLPAPRALADRGKLERVFYNLLQNALRHTPKGSRIVVRLRAEATTIRVSVEDEGRGVPAELVPQLFQKFVRGSSGSGKAGLGLFFCRITVERWGGAIGYEPRAGGGACFWFRLARVAEA